MPTFKQITAVRKTLYLESLAATGSYAEAIIAAGVSASLPHYWRRTDSTFVKAEDQAKRKTAQEMLRAGRTRRGRTKLPKR